MEPVVPIVAVPVEKSLEVVARVAVDPDIAGGVFFYRNGIGGGIAEEIFRTERSHGGTLESLPGYNDVRTGFEIEGKAAGIVEALVGMATMTAVYVARSANGPLFRGWINKQIAPQVRATVLSMWGQMDAMGQMIGGPILGAVATAISIPAAMGGVALLLTPVPVLYVVALRWTARAKERGVAEQVV